MSLFDFLTKSPSLAARITAILTLPIGGNKTRQTNVVLPVNTVSIATQPGIKGGFPILSQVRGGMICFRGTQAELMYL
jgi:hypothetical protein